MAQETTITDDSIRSWIETSSNLVAGPIDSERLNNNVLKIVGEVYHVLANLKALKMKYRMDSTDEGSEGSTRELEPRGTNAPALFSLALPSQGRSSTRHDDAISQVSSEISNTGMMRCGKCCRPASADLAMQWSVLGLSRCQRTTANWRILGVQRMP
jgi:hypothetical protein